MIISFDIDNTLIPYSDEFPVEVPPPMARLLGVEPLRKGTRDLVKALEKRGHVIWIYTTSFRSKWSLRKTLYWHGILPGRIINEEINLRKLKQAKCTASKHPRLFGIDLHVDDSPGVQLEGERMGFDVVLVRTDDAHWVDTVIREVSVRELHNGGG